MIPKLIRFYFFDIDDRIAKIYSHYVKNNAFYLNCGLDIAIKSNEMVFLKFHKTYS